MAALTRPFQLLPPLVVLWMMMRAGRVFTPNAGQRDARGLGIIVSMWGTLAATQLAITPPLLMQVLGAAGIVASLGLYEWSASSIRGRVFSYAGNHDLPQFVHRSGPYAYVRNPFYLSYLLAEISIVVIWPSVWGAMVVALAAAYFQWLARYEEGKFSRSPVAAEYAEYMARTGRLLPRLPLP
ncbi:MAG TPA: isoprenylcysteine carboxylmethyltransferase family protein [Vicinamibacterales bacterium]|nr:isoprenylcysteine carboxylmethyltransferase family protein [Vicinamibacterales bacterium]